MAVIGYGYWQRRFGGRLRQLLTETLLLFVVGAAGSFAVARLALDALVGFFAIGRNAITLEATVDWRAAAFAAAITMVAGVCTGLWPAIRALRVAPLAAMRSGDTRVGGARVPMLPRASSSSGSPRFAWRSWCRRCSLPPP